jgi:hypothetical protein
MTAISFRFQQCIISFIGAFLFLPVYLFWGGLFSFSFTIIDSAWAWGFGLTACWCQILAILFSFLRPRKAGYWILANTGLSILLTIGYLIDKDASPLEALAIWPYAHSSYWKTGIIFWALPIFFALLLLRREPKKLKKQPA